ncbi:MAG: LEA type 2 family protein [Thermotogae bacterium]|nr:LEA type 2 family protein [Thermotogota bacterium]
MRYVAFTLIFGTLLVGCATVQERVSLKDCEFSIQGAKLRNVDLQGFSMDVLLKVVNPNSIDAVVDKFVGSVFIEGLKVADVSTKYGERVPAGSSVILPISVDVKYSYLKEAASRLLNVITLRRAEVGIEGKAYMEFDVPLLGKKTVPYPIKLSRTVSF